MSTDFYSPILTDFLIRAASTIVSQSASAPLLRIQLILQSQSRISLTSPLSTYNSLVSTSGPSSLWRGAILSTAHTFLASTFALSTTSFLRPYLFSQYHDGYILSLLSSLVSSTLTSTITQLLLHPLQYTHLRLAVDTQSGAVFPETALPYRFPSFQDVVKQTYESDGLAGFYRGIVPSIIHSVVRSTSYLLSRNFVFGPLLDTSSWRGGKTAMFLAMGLIAGAANLVAYPFGTVGVKMDLESCPMEKSKSKRKHGSMRDAAWQIVYTQGGYGALWNGVGVYFAQVLTANGAAYAFRRLSGL